MGVISSFVFTMKYPDLAKKIRAALPEIQLVTAAAMQANRGLLFRQSGAYNGHQRWKDPLLRSGQPLKDRGTLSQSLAPNGSRSAGGRPGKRDGSIVRISGGKVTIGSNLKKAWLMNWGTTKLPGGVLTAKTAQALMIPIPGGKKATDTAKGLRKGAPKVDGKAVMFRRSVKIPARHFDELNAQDRKELAGVISAKVAQILNR